MGQLRRISGLSGGGEVKVEEGCERGDERKGKREMENASGLEF